MFDEIRKVFAGTRDARRRGYRAGRFSFNIKGGRCEECQGQGQRQIEMNFLPDLYVPCPVCEGKRFNRADAGDPLPRPLDRRRAGDARGRGGRVLREFPAIARLLGSLQEVGLGYVTLGQSSITLSGGEAQRIKLATELGRVDTGKTFYILDEPTTGLHFDDIKKLLVVLGRLVDLGNTVVVIEHNLDVIKSADWIIDLGPKGARRRPDRRHRHARADRRDGGQLHGALPAGGAGWEGGGIGRRKVGGMISASRGVYPPRLGLIARQPADLVKAVASVSCESFLRRGINSGCWRKSE